MRKECYALPMREIEITPNGDIEFGTYTDEAGKTFVCLKLQDGDTSAFVIFTLAHFVRAAEQMNDVAERLVAKHPI